MGDETLQIIELLNQVNIDCEHGSISRKGEIIPVYIIRNTETNKALLNLPTIEEEGSSKGELLSKISHMQVRLRSQDERINYLEGVTKDLEEELSEAKKEQKKASYSRYYYGKQVEELREKLSELRRVRTLLVEENERLRIENQQLRQLLEEHPIEEITEQTTSVIPVREPSDQSELALLQAEVQELRQLISEQSRHQTEQAELIVTKELRLPASMLTEGSNEMRRLLEILGVLLSSLDNWLLLILESGQPKSLDTIQTALDWPTQKRREILRKLQHFEDLGIVKREVLANGEEVYGIDHTGVRLSRRDMEGNFSRQDVPYDVRTLARLVQRVLSGSRPRTPIQIE